MQHKLANGIIVIFGASGDLTARKLIPAIFHLYQHKSLTKNNIVLGVSRSAFNDEQFRQKMCEALLTEYPDDQKSINKFLNQIYYQSIDVYTDEGYTLLNKRLKALLKSHKLDNNLLFYLSTPPSLYYQIPSHLAKLGLNDETDGYKRIIIEKPFGIDEKSACALNAHLLQHYKESQLFRIDHYLGKETVQNLLVFRFANSIFEPLWNAAHIDNVQIYANESIGLGSRAGYYDQNGAIRDMIQNHLLQLLGIVAMEAPAKMDAYSIRNETLKVFQSIRRFRTAEDIKQNVVIAQYQEGCVQGVIKGSYRDEQAVAKDSTTETYAAIRFFIDNWRWHNVPFYVRTGKRLNQRVSEVVINFKPTPHPFFSQVQKITKFKNQLVIRIQPDEGIKLSFAAKEPGSGFKTHEVDMGFYYSDFAQKALPTAYERLILDALQGDNTLFARNDAVEACWNIIDPIIQYIHKHGKSILNFYPSGSFGPVESDKMLAELDHIWRNPSSNFKQNSKA
ncbi:glucose-6-phosphate dehydrogenase [Fastidiosibacter lacustris]|uniref:glucose-6-phosphate dehydrogenase n=1 Tax=Fastidiosibacter lacustris TaxID=2056695 RepID=UPI000E342BC2|nr:glucose-6-phosphate dehydrogenase [Fastidiosibacter lacustris]